MDSMAKQRRSRDWARRLGASLPMRIMHHGLGSLAPPHTRMWHDHSCTQPQLPSDVVIPTTASVPSCSEPSRTRPLRVALRAILDRSCARRRLDRVGRDEETGCPGRTKKLTMK